MPPTAPRLIVPRGRRPAAVAAGAPRDRPTAPVAALAVALLAACGSDPATPDPTQPSPGTASGTPTALAVLGQGVVTDRFTAEVTARGAWVYTSTWGRRSAPGNVVYVWHAAGSTPVLTDSLVIDGVVTTGDVQAIDDLLVVATEPRNAGALVVYSLADPAHPRLLTRFAPPQLTPGVHTAQVSRVNGRLYAFAAVNAGTATSPGVAIVDLGDVAAGGAPRVVWFRALGEPNVHDTHVRDGILFTANWNGGVMAWDVGGAGRGGSPAAPVQLGAMRTVAVNAQAGPSVHNMYLLPAAGGRRFLLVGEEMALGLTIGGTSAGDVHVVDVTDLANPSTWREVAFFHVPGAGVHNFAVDEAQGVLYAAFYNGGVRAIDVRGDLGTCSAAQRGMDQRCDLRLMGRELGVALAGSPRTRDPRVPTDYPPFVWGVELQGDALYASDMLGGLWKLRALTR